MNTLSRFTLVVTLMVAFVLTAVSADKTLKVVQKFSKENIIGHNGNIYMADVNGDGHKDIVARWSRNKKLIGGIWLPGLTAAGDLKCAIIHAASRAVPPAPRFGPGFPSSPRPSAWQVEQRSFWK